MSLASKNKLAHEPASKSDPAHASSENTDHTTRSGEKPASAVEFITDTSFIPTLDHAPLAQKIKSYLLLSLTVAGIVTTLWFFDFALFQTASSSTLTTTGDVPGPLAAPPPATLGQVVREVGTMTAGVSLGIMLLLYATGTAHVDYWSLVMEYGWYTLPLVAAVGVVFVMAKETTEPVGDLE